MKEMIVIRKMANGFLVLERSDLIANSDSYVFNSFNDMTEFLRKNFSIKPENIWEDIDHVELSEEKKNK